MFLNKLKMMAAVLAAAVAGTGVLALQAPAEPPADQAVEDPKTSDPAPAAAGPQASAPEFDKLHRLIRPQAGESRWMEIAWYPNVWEARQKAARDGKPLFIWAGSGGAPAAGC